MPFLLCFVPTVMVSSNMTTIDGGVLYVDTVTAYPPLPSFVSPTLLSVPSMPNPFPGPARAFLAASHRSYSTASVPSLPILFGITPSLYISDSLVVSRGLFRVVTPVIIEGSIVVGASRSTPAVIEVLSSLRFSWSVYHDS